MKKTFLVVQQLSQQLKPWHTLPTRPRTGWIRTLRKALGMTTQQLAQRLGVNRSRVVKIERDEVDEALTLHTLKKTAAALNCKLVYALVPNAPLPQLLAQQAEKIARKQAMKIDHSMTLENQQTTPQALQTQINFLKDQLLHGNLKHLWEED